MFVIVWDCVCLHVYVAWLVCLRELKYRPLLSLVVCVHHKEVDIMVITVATNHNPLKLQNFGSNS